MTDQHADLFWDSCVFITYLTGVPADWAQHVDDWLNSAASSDGPTIYYSTIAMAEIKPSHLANKNLGTFQEFLDSIDAEFLPVDPNPNIMLNAARMRDVEPIHPGKAAKRVISMADAIQLASCVFARDEMNIPGIVFHTLDHKAGTNAGERTVPIIGLEEWFEVKRRNAILQAVCNLPREFPRHPSPTLPGVVRPAVSTAGNGAALRNGR